MTACDDLSLKFKELTKRQRQDGMARERARRAKKQIQGLVGRDYINVTNPRR